MTLYKWSQIAASDATADSSINWQEGQAPSSVNDSGRAMMAATAKYRDDIAGAIVTAGTSTAYTVSSYQVFDTLAHMGGQMIAFTPHATCGATVTLNVDGLGAKALRSSPGIELQAGTLVQGTPYLVLYNSSDAAFYLHGFYGNNPYNVPLGGMIDYTATTAPNSSFVIPSGQAISRTAYASYFALVGTTYGAGDGSTTFNVLDMRGRVAAMIDAAGTILNGTYFPNSGTIGTTGGADHVTLVTANLPPYTPAGTVANGAITITQNANINNGGSSVAAGGNGNITNGGAATITASQAASTFTGTAQGGTSTGVRTIPPMIVLNKILRVI